MKRLIIVAIGLSVLSCQSTKTGMSEEEFEIKIQSAEKLNVANKQSVDGWYETIPTKNEFKRIDKKTSKEYFINPKPIVLPDNFSNGEEFENYKGFKGFAVYFDNQGIEAWSKATKDNIGSHLIFILDNEILTIQVVNSQITNGTSVFWKNDLTIDQWEKIKDLIKK